MRRVIIDTDPGVDDMFAILSALGSRSLQVIGITTVGGNTGLQQTTRNALRILAAASRPDVPVYAGAAGPLVGAAHVHGEDGILGTPLPEPVSEASKEFAVDYLCRVLMDSEPGSIDLACLGPLTNLALALEREPRIVGRLRSVVVMGGGFGTYSSTTYGNVTAAAEFNIYSDPEAAARVAASDVDMTLIPLDVSHRTVVTPEWLKELATVPRWGPVLVRTLEAYCGNNEGPLHDPNVLAYLELPEIYQTVRARLEVDCSEGESRGATKLAGEGPHQVALDVAAGLFFDLLLANLRRVSCSN